MSTRVIARRYTLDVPEPAVPGAAVWRGRDSTTGGAVVVTLLDEHPAADATLAALVAVRHPALPVVLDHGIDGVTRYVVTPARSGQAARVRLQGVAPLEAAEVAAQLADALAALHARGLVQGRLDLASIVQDEGGPLRLEDLATGGLARPADQPDDDLRRLADVLRELLGLAPDADPLAAEGVPPRLAGLLQSLSSFTPPPAVDARDALRRIAREDRTASWEPFAAAGVAPPATPAPASVAPPRNRGLKVLVGLLAIAVVALAAVVIAGVVDRRDADCRAAVTELPGPITTIPAPAGDDDADFTAPEQPTTAEEDDPATTAAAPVGPDRTPRPLRVARAIAHDPAGDAKENDGQTRLAIDGSPRTGWSTEIYRQGAIESKRGVGLQLRLATPSRVRRIALRSAPVGATIVVYGIRGATPARIPRDWTPLSAPRELARPLSVIPIRRTAPLTDVLIWVTGLPAVKGGFAVALDDVSVIGVPTGA